MSSLVDPTTTLSGSPNGGAGIARYAQVAAILRERITTGCWPPGHQVPTLERLAEEFDAARVTIRQAISLLEADGLIWRRRGRGTFVAEHAADATLHAATSWDELLLSLADNWARPLAAESVSGREVATAFALPDTDHLATHYRRLRRVHGRGGRAHAHVTLNLDASIYALNPEGFDAAMLIPELERVAPGRIARAQQTLTIATADAETAAVLTMPTGAPTGRLRRILTDASGHVLYAGEVIYRGDTVRIEMDLQRPEVHRAAC